jgi:tetratricopeptide (TPR) repeat protein
MSQRPATVDALVAEAKRVTQVLVVGFPNDPGVHDMVARVHNQIGESTEAVQAWEKSLALNPDYSYAHRGLATVAAQKGDNEKAASLLRRSLVLDPNSFEAQTQLAQVLIDLNRMEEAIKLLESNVAADPRPYRGRVLMGMAYMQLGEYQKAKECYEAAIEAHPKHANAHFGLASAYARLGEQDLHQEYLAKFQELRDGEREIASDQRLQYDDLDTMCAGVAQIYADAAKICVTQGRPQEGEILCRRAAVLDPENVDCRQALAWMYQVTGRQADAIGMLEKLAQMNPQQITYRLEIARLHSAMGRLPAARQTLKRACEEAPENPIGYVALADFLLSHGQDLTEAAELAQTATQLDPSAANYVLLGTIYERDGQIPQAIEAMGQAVTADPNNLQYQQMYELLKEKQKGE